MAAAHIAEAIRLLMSVDRRKFEEITTDLQPFIKRIQQFRGGEEN